MRPTYGPTEVFLQEPPARLSPPRTDIRGLIVNHHLLASDFIADTLHRVDWSVIDRVILISPNHFLAGRGLAISTVFDWQTPFGPLAADRPAIARLAKTGVVNLDTSVLSKEHGLYNLLPYLRRVDPNVRIIPIAVRDGTPAYRIRQLQDRLVKLMNARTLVIGSFDFSHYQTSAVADAHDEVSIEVVQRLAADATTGLDIDSAPGLALMLGLMRADGAEVFELIHHSNSAKLTGYLDATETTSYVTGVFAPRFGNRYTNSALIHR